MFFHPNDNKLALIIKHLVAITALLSMIMLFVYAILQNSNIKQQEKIVIIDIKNRVNICVAENGAFEEKSFFSF